MVCAMTKPVQPTQGAEEVRYMEKPRGVGKPLSELFKETARIVERLDLTDEEKDARIEALQKRHAAQRAEAVPPEQSDEDVAREIADGFYAINSRQRSKQYLTNQIRKAFARHVQARIAAAQPTWQPIRTAPKDGTHILVYRPISNEFIPKVGIDYWYDRSTTVPYWAKSNSSTQPTHWQPLPAVPTTISPHSTLPAQ